MSFVRTFDADHRPTGLLRHVAPLLDYPALVWRNRYMVQNFSRRELMSRWHGSFLGAWWMLVQPLFLFAVYYLVFGFLHARGNDPSPAFALYLFSGIIVFHALTEATSTNCAVVVANSNLVKKVAFPSEVLPIPSTLVSIVVYVVGAIVCLTVGTLAGVLHPGLELAALPLVLVVQFVLTLGLGFLLANANVFVRDTAQLWRIASMAWMFVSPVFWTPDMLFEKAAAGSILPWLVFHLNPAYPLLQAHRIALGGESAALGITGFWGHLGVASLWAIGFLLVGYTTFVSSKHKYADVV